jgi:RND family efflux transporter MFP subunit
VETPILRLVPLVAGQGDLGVEAARELAAAQARHEAARQRAARAEQMLADRAGSVRSLEEARAELRVARADLDAAQARAARAARNSFDPNGGLVLRAPREAVLAGMHVGVGQTVAAGAPLFELVSTDPLWVRVPVYTGELADLDATAPARVRALGSPLDAPDREGTPVPSPPMADFTASSADLLFEVANPDGALRVGERVSVSLTRAGSALSRLVPASALLYDFQGGTWVYAVVGPQLYRRERVEAESVADGVARLVRGPAAGARVVTAGVAELYGAEFAGE